MRISAKGCYALAALIEIASQATSEEPISVLRISEKLGISKLFLEQTISLLRKNGLLHSIKGKNGGYRLASSPDKITVRDILFTVEGGLFEKTDTANLDQSPAIAQSLEQLIFSPLDQAVEDCLSDVTLQALLDHASQQNSDQSFMLYM